MMNCKQIEPLLQDHLDGDLLPSMQAVLEEHLGSCPSCRLMAAEMRSLGGGLADLPEVEEPADLACRIVADLPREQRGRSTSPRLIHRGVAALAAMVLAAFAFIAAGNFDLYGGDAAREVTIEFRAPSAATVAIVGDFNGWNPESHLMVSGEEGRVWRLKLRLKPGVYEYGFLVDGKDWLADPNADGFTADGFGGENSILIIEG